MKYLLLLFVVGASFLAVFHPAKALAATDLLNKACTAQTAQSVACKDQIKDGSNPIFGPTGILTKAVRVIQIITAAAAVIMIIISGIQYVLSEGDSGKVTNARSSIIYAVVGLVIVLISQALVVFVLNKL